MADPLDTLEFDETELFGGLDPEDDTRSSGASSTADEQAVEEAEDDDEASATGSRPVGTSERAVQQVKDDEFGSMGMGSRGLSPSASSRPISFSPSKGSWRTSNDFGKNSGRLPQQQHNMPGRFNMSLPNGPSHLGCSLPVQVPVWERKEAMDEDEEEGPIVKRVVMASTFIPPHQLSFNSNDFLANLQAGTSPAAGLKKDKLRARNAILRSTGFLEHGTPAPPLPGLPSRPAGTASGALTSQLASEPPPTILGGFGTAPPSRQASSDLEKARLSSPSPALPPGVPLDGMTPTPLPAPPPLPPLPE